ncbi:MAG: hypothetical protein NW215_12370 [Hyphomicrobiales bacterium]|nr:hypothetical protein [Hyphomicrobiales bacterium]
MKRVLRTLFAATAVFGAVAYAEAAPVCVACAGPDRTYACSVEDAAGGVSRGAGMFCMQRLAEDHGHASCAVLRNARCDGDPVSYRADALPPAAAPEVAPPADAEKPPTLAGVAKDAVAKSGETVKKTGETVGAALKNTGQAVGDAAKKTWRCIGSALTEC